MYSSQQAVLRQQGATNKSSSAVLLSATYPADRTQMSSRICSHLLYLRAAAVPGGTFSKCPAERKAVAVAGNAARNSGASFTIIFRQLSGDRIQQVMLVIFLTQGFKGSFFFGRAVLFLLALRGRHRTIILQSRYF